MTLKKARQPKLSVCIPTYNRANFLDKCLNSITCQFEDKKIYQKVEIIISDNASKDNSQEIVKKYKKKYLNIKYFRRKITIQGDMNIISTASFASGAYFWFFSDDDIHYKWSLKTILKVIEEFHPDGIICNLDLCSKDGVKILDRNMLHLENNTLVDSKKKLFKFLETKFFLPLDWYITCQSNTIVSSKLYSDNLSELIKKYYDSTTINFLHSGLIYYNKKDYKILMVAKPVAQFRADNRAFGPDEHTRKGEYLSFLYKHLRKHNDLILKINKKSISKKFSFLIYLKNMTRSLRLFMVRYFDHDISSLLIRLFQKKN